MANNAREKASEYFKEEVKALLSGYIPSEDTRSYLALKITQLHDFYSKEVMSDER